MMMGLEVKQVLKNLCLSYGWSYAVFWCHDSINPMLLRFEEAYNDEQSVAVVDDITIQPQILGQGMVGEAALTGNHQWLFSDTLLFQCEHEFQNQFLSGFKTITIIPVGSSGVVQLGSTQKILESQVLLEQTTRALHEICLKPDQPVSELDTLFDSLVPLGDYENIVPDSHQGLSYDDFIPLREEDSPPCLLSPEIMVTGEATVNPTSFQDSDEFGFDFLKSYSLDELLADSPEHKCSSNDHQEGNSIVIQGDDKDLFDMLGISSGDSSSVSHGVFGATQAPLASSTPKFQGLFSELISSSLSSNTISSSLTNVQDYYSGSGLNQSKKRKLETSSAQSSSFVPQMTPQERDEEERSSVAGNWKKPHEEGVKKKRAKAGESRKPRPKDRQMIQDRIKEIRGMIPNGSKCSIDTLLDLTIKHMVFMQSIAKYADKLKQPYESKLVKEKERTWAVEVNGDNESLCPIIVEDLKPQGQMEIEMLCEESGEFLEISDVIKGLGMNILKGVMERKQGQIWSHFIVEAKPQVTRLEVFWSLVQLFQQKKHKSTDL